MWAIVNRYRDEEGNFQIRGVYAPYESKEAAENASWKELNFPSPEYNLIVRFWTAESLEAVKL